MSDITLTWDPAIGAADISMAGPSLELGDDLETAVLISLFTDHVTDPGDVLLSDISKDPRGWWADTYTAPDEIGSKLWQVLNRTRNQDTLNFAQNTAVQALQWMIDDGVASAVSVVPAFAGSAGISLSIAITQPSGTVTQFSYAWSGVN